MGEENEENIEENVGHKRNTSDYIWANAQSEVGKATKNYKL